MEPVYLSSLKDHKVGFKNVTLCQMINHLIFKYTVPSKQRSKGRPEENSRAVGPKQEHQIHVQMHPECA